MRDSLRRTSGLMVYVCIVSVKRMNELNHVAIFASYFLTAHCRVPLPEPCDSLRFLPPMQPCIQRQTHKVRDWLVEEQTCHI